LLAGQFLAIQPHASRARRHHAHQALQRRALARAVAPEQRHDLVLFDAQPDIEKDVAVAVVTVQSADFEQAHATSSSCTPPRYASCTLGLFLISSGVPSTRTLPSWRTVTFSTNSNSESMS